MMMSNSPLSSLATLARPLAAPVRYIARQLATRKQTLSALRESEHRYRSVVDSVKEVIFRVTPQGLYLFLNPAWTDITGFSLEESLGRSFLDFVSPEDRQPALQRFHRLTTRAVSSIHYEVRYKKKTADGQTAFVWLEGYARLQVDEKNRVTGVTGTLRDVTDRRAAESALHSRDTLLQAVADATRALLKTPDFDVAIPQALAILGGGTATERVYLFQNHADSTGKIPLVSQRFEWCAPNTPPELNNPSTQNQPWSQFDNWHDTLAGGSCIQGRPDQFSPHLCELLRAQHVRSILLVPVFVNHAQDAAAPDEFWGFLGFDECSHPRSWTEAETSILQAMAASIGGAISRQRADNALQQAKEAAEAGSRAKSQFLATMSHEIRTPLNGILGMTDLLLATPLSEHQRKYAALTKTSADTLLAVINDILDFSKVEAGKLELDPTPFALHPLLKQTTEMLALKAESKGLTLTCHIQPDVPPHLFGDALRLRQVLINLINNAIKFTDKGSVTLRVESLSTHRSSDLAPSLAQLRFRIIDTGIGIPADRLSRLFKSFSQVDSSTTRRYGGTGLGLAISKQLVELLGGTIGVESTEGKGSTFWFTARMEIRQPSAEGSSAPVVSAALPRFQPARVLLAEDHEVNQLLAKELLTRANLSVDVVPDGAEAFNAYLTGHYALILMDCQMPCVDGFEATRAIRKHEERRKITSPIPIVALTANAIKGDRERCLDAGMSAYLTKPIDPAGLAQALAQFLPLDEAQPACEPIAAPAIATSVPREVSAEVAAASAEPIDRRELLNRCMGSEAMVAKVLNLFHKQTGEFIAQLDALAEKQDAAELSKLAHSIKGAAANLSAKKLKAAASVLEKNARANDLSNLAAEISALQAELTTTAAAIRDPAKTGI